jgi:outer membrane immunogenic protein
MKSKLLSSVAGTALASALGASAPAYAATPAPMQDWTGFYAGLYAGGAWSRANATTAVLTCPAIVGVTGGYFCTSTFPNRAPNAAAVAAAGTGSLSGSSFVGGLQAGYNWQAGQVVYGVEADFGSFHLRASRQGSSTYPAGPMAGAGITYGSSIATDWLFTARGRLGWSVSDWLLFVTGGLAVANIKTTVSFNDAYAVGAVPGATGSGSGSSTKVGWTVGGGAEYALNKHWSVKAEYLYVSFGSVSALATVRHTGAGFAGYSNLLRTSTDLSAHIARVGVNYRF